MCNHSHFIGEIFVHIFMWGEKGSIPKPSRTYISKPGQLEGYETWKATICKSLLSQIASCVPTPMPTQRF